MMATQRDSGQAPYLHRREVFARLAKQLLPASNPLAVSIQQDLYTPLDLEAELYKQVNLGNLLITDITEFNFSAPTLAAGANAGGSPPAPVLGTGSTDGRGNVTFGTGTTPAAGAMVVVTFGTPLPVGRIPYVSLDPSNAAAAPLATYITATSNTGFTIALATAPAASQANTTYSIHYTVS